MSSRLLFFRHKLFVEQLAVLSKKNNSVGSFRVFVDSRRFDFEVSRRWRNPSLGIFTVNKNALFCKTFVKGLLLNYWRILSLFCPN